MSPNSHQDELILWRRDIWLLTCHGLWCEIGFWCARGKHCGVVASNAAFTVEDGGFELKSEYCLYWRMMFIVSFSPFRKVLRSRGQLKCDGTRAETRFLLSAKRTSPFKSAEASVQSTAGSWGVRISGSNVGYTMFRCSVKGTGCTLQLSASPSLPLPWVTVCHHISTGLYHKMFYKRPIPNNSHITSHTVFPSLKTVKLFMNGLKAGLMNTCQNLIYIYKCNLYFFFQPLRRGSATMNQSPPTSHPLPRNWKLCAY